MKSSALARDYEVPKKPMFLLEGMEIVQSSDATAYVPNSVADSVMYGTNGHLGLRHRSEMETISFVTEVMMNGVYHVTSRESMVNCAALPSQKQTGASIGLIGLDFTVDGDSGTLSCIPERRLSLSDGSYRSVCKDVMSSDGGIMFDTHYTRAVATDEPSLWAAEVIYSNFRLEPPNMQEYDLVSDGMAGYSNSMDNSAALRWGPHSPHLGSSGEMVGNPMRPLRYKLSAVATFIVDLTDWEVMKAAQMDDVWQRSLTSNVMLNTTTSVTCTIEYPNAPPSHIIPDVEVNSCFEQMDYPQSPFAYNQYGHTIYSQEDNNNGYALSHELSSNGNRAKPTPLLHAAVPPLVTNDINSGKKQFLIKKTFTFSMVSTEPIPTQVVLSFKARHVKSGPAPAIPFPLITEVIDRRRQSLEEFWNNFQVDMQLQDELTPDRTKLALLYNAFRLYSLGSHLQQGMTASGCSSSGEGLLYQLSDYLFYVLYYCLTQPCCALDLLKSLYKILPVCRQNAEDLCLQHGAIYPMSTIKGTNCRHYSNSNNARFQVNSEIGLMVKYYLAAVDNIPVEDRLMLLELLLETARVWLPLGEWHDDKSVFRLDNIAGADEYNSSVSGNFYVHLSAKHHLRSAVEIVAQQDQIVGAYLVDALLNRIGMDRAELETMKQAAEAISVKRDERLDVYMVHDYFDKLEPWVGGAKHPLNLNYHPLAIYRRKVVEVPEVLLGMFVHDYEFDAVDFEKNYMYYRPLCTLDSPISIGVLALAQCRARREFSQPMPYLRSLANFDLDNIVYTAEEGLHCGAMVMSLGTLILGLGGVSIGSGDLRLSPFLPASVTRYCFTICWKGSTMQVSMDTEKLTYELVSGDSIRFIHGTDRHRIHLHTGFSRVEAKQRVSIPRISASRFTHFDGAVFLSDCLFHNLYEYNYVSWYRVLETLFDTYRNLQNRRIPPLNPEEFIEYVVYQKEKHEIAFSGIHNILLSRGINLELGTPDDAEIVETRYGLANAKVADMGELLEQNPPKMCVEMFQLMRRLLEGGVAMAVVTYSRSLKQLLMYSEEMRSLFMAYIDGEEAHDRHILARPHLDLYLRAAEKIHVHPSRCLVFSHHLDRDFEAENLAQFHMFLDLEDPFVSSRVPLRPYPTLDEKLIASLKRENPVVRRLHINNVPTTGDQLEDLLEGYNTRPNSEN
ncbi:hypothetical protein STCU_08550 [Strigomonas culicis]|uniref:Glycosyl hydrolase n=1 Tax=Strigomonas culicis TaxID=28005 RepID=S9VE83_9TRYP|nr:hypothetical protein STCU_08550 [Strigomonas culicis]|eukprot:EPY21430.1 hypothetical protein STCU_08550 [Strigomonas culicis]